MSPRRFSAHAASSWPGLRGFSLPKLTVSICPSCAPMSVIIRLTASARFWPSAMLYSREPRSSVLPWIVARAVVREVAPCASTSGRNSSLTTKLSKSK